MEQRKNTTLSKLNSESYQADLPFLRYICLSSGVHEVGRSCRHTPGHLNMMPSWVQGTARVSPKPGTE